MKRVPWLALLIFSFSFPVLGRADEGAVGRGQTIYTLHCARCHGADGKGNGVDAKRVVIPPRDLTSGKFKFKSTVWGTPPSDEDLIKGVLGHGLAGSGMPSFGNLSEAARADVVAYIKSISPIFQSGQKPEPIPDPSNRRAKPDLVKGKEVFKTMQCASCHGENGRANGPSAATLVDAWGKPIKAANLTHGWTYRGGSKPIDIYHRILAGIEGAPMPSYEGAASHEDIWHMCNYVASLQLKTNWAGDLHAQPIKGNLPLTAEDPSWDKVPHVDINLQNYFYSNGQRLPLTVNSVSVQAVKNEQSIAFRISWDDPNEDRGRGKSDALLLAFKPKDYDGDIRGNLFNLYEPGAPALDLMIWQASNAGRVGFKKSSLSSFVNSDGNYSQTYEAASTFVDGRWSLVFVRPLDGTSHLIGFSAWDGRNNESGLKNSSSQWIRLHVGASQESH
ncbi:MAG: hypothetical protein KCHDKBKB_02742 [Elusimicrobia bacterium]|nr:hypothetical protein [Elusimicrobiota bacterium]